MQRVCVAIGLVGWLCASGADDGGLDRWWFGLPPEFRDPVHNKRTGISLRNNPVDEVYIMRVEIFKLREKRTPKDSSNEDRVHD